MTPNQKKAIDNKPRPFFVYGTLRVGHPNYMGWLLKVAEPVRVEKAEVFGCTLLRAPRSMFPYLVEIKDLPTWLRNGAGDSVHGELLWFDDKDFKEVRAALDELEGVDYGHYDRKVMQTAPAPLSAAGAHDAYVYVASRDVIRHSFHNPHVGRDWEQYVKDNTIYSIAEKKE